MSDSTHSWGCASPDFNVRLTGELIAPFTSFTDGAQFKLAEGGIHIEHPSLVAVSTTPSSQTLRSLNSNTAIFTLTLPKPFDPISTTPATDAPTAGTIITLHTVIPFSSFATLHQSPLFSQTFNILLDGPNFPPPRFDPLYIPPSSLSSNPLSPLLSPQPTPFAPSSPERGRGRSSSISAGVGDLIPPLRLSMSRSRIRPSPSPAKPSGIYALLPPSAAGITSSSGIASTALAELATTSISRLSKANAEEIMALRRAHEARILRIRNELDVLEKRVSGSGFSILSTPGGRASQEGGTRVIKGFNIATPVVVDSRSRSREGRTASRNREVREGGTERDELVSKLFVGEDKEIEKEEIERGRSTSRSRSRTNKSEGKHKDKAKNDEVPQKVTYIAATLDEEDEAEIEEKERHQTPPPPPPKEAPVATPISTTFAPHSLGLIAIPESEELLLPVSPPIKTVPVSVPTNGNGVHGEKEDSEEHEAMFDLDEDIETTPLPHSPIAPEPEIPLPTPSPPPASTSTFRPSSFRPSSLSASYAGLLSSSLARRPPPPPPILSPPPQRSIITASSPDPLHPTQPTAREDALDALAFIPPASEEAARSANKHLREAWALDIPSHRTNLPRRRKSLTDKNYSRRNSQEDEITEDEIEDEEEDDNGLNNFTVGSLPITIGPRPSKHKFSTFSIYEDEERELIRKTSVPTRREGFFVPPLPLKPALASPGGGIGGTIAGKGKGKTVSIAEVSAVSAVVSPMSSPSRAGIPIGGGSSITDTKTFVGSLRTGGIAASFINPPEQFLSKRLEEEEEIERSLTKGVSKSPQEGQDGWVPPHVWAQGELRPEELLSRSLFPKF